MAETDTICKDTRTTSNAKYAEVQSQGGCALDKVVQCTYI